MIQSQQRPTQAVILAGGLGARLRPLTDTIPKPMVRFHDKPFLEYLLELLKEQGFMKALLLLGYLPDVVIDYFGDGSDFGIEIEYSVTPVEDETGARLRTAYDRIDSLFFMIYCDNYIPFSFEKMWETYCDGRAEALMTAYGNRDGYTKNNLRINADDYIELYDKSRTEDNLAGVDIGYIILQKTALDLMPEGNVSFEATVYPQLVEQGYMKAYLTHHRYYSVGKLERLPDTEQFLARGPVVLIDRDGVLNQKMPRAEYVRSWDDWRWIDGAKEGLSLFADAGYKVVLISNQAGIARGAMTDDDLTAIHNKMKEEIAEAGGRVDAIYHCPHDWDENCFCRKPSPGMLLDAQRDFHLDLSRTVFIGDDDRDGVAADAAGALWEKVADKRSLLDIAREMTGVFLHR